MAVLRIGVKVKVSIEAPSTRKATENNIANQLPQKCRPYSLVDAIREMKYPLQI